MGKELDPKDQDVVILEDKKHVNLIRKKKASELLPEDKKHKNHRFYCYEKKDYKCLTL